MVGIDFLAGSEERAIEFIKNISDKDKVAILSHVDLDGMASGKVISKAVKYELLKFVAYEMINDDLVKELKSKKITKVIMSDLAVDNIKIIKNIEKFAQILMIDHHLFDEDFNSERTVFLNNQEHCAAYLCYLIFSKVKKIEEIDWLVTCACISDWKYFNNEEFMKKIMKKYGDKFEIINGNIRKSGKFWDLQLKLSLALIYFGYTLHKAFDLLKDDMNKLDGLLKYNGVVEKEIDDCVKKFEKEKEVFGDVYLWEFRGQFQIKSIVSTIVSVKHPHNTIIIVKRNQKYSTFSARRQDKKVNVARLLQKSLTGIKDSFAGGHVPAGGGQVLHKDFAKFKENLKKLALK